MRLFKIAGESSFIEFAPQRFSHTQREETLESWLEENPDAIVDDGKLLVIGRQVSTVFGTFIDILGLDREGNVVVVELKRERTPRETLAQALEYAAFAERLTYEDLKEIAYRSSGDDVQDLQDTHREYFHLEPSDAVSFNKDQRIVIVGSPVSEEIRSTSSFLSGKGVQVTCVEFAFFETDAGEQLISTDIVAGGMSARRRTIDTAVSRWTDRLSFLAALDDNGLAVFTRLLDLADRESMVIRWGKKGFSLNADLDGSYVVLIVGFPPSSVYGQSVLSGFSYMGQKINDANRIIDEYRQKLSQLGVFSPAGRELKWTISEGDNDSIVDKLESIIVDVKNDILACGLLE